MVIDPARPRLPSLAGSRGLAALLVFAVHGWGTVWVAGMSLEAMGRGTRLATPLVAFFFVLSGFVMVWSARSGDTAGRFWRRRAAKILPNHVLLWALCLVLLVGSSATLISTVPTLLLVQNWLPILEMNHGTSVVAWSLSVEAFCYLMFPLLLPLVRRLPATALWPAVGVVFMAIVAVPTAALFVTVGAPLPHLGITETQYWLVFLLPPVRMLEFILGMLLALILLEGRRAPVGITTAGALVVAGLVLGQLLPAVYAFAAVCSLPLGLFLLALADADRAGTTSLLRTRAAVWLGDTSYAIYLSHILVITLVAGAIPAGTTRDFGSGIAVMLVALVLCVAFSRLLFRAVEDPFSRRFGAAGLRRPAPPVAVPSPLGMQEPR